jgi:DNA-binding CsgD family transcriptional regulator
MDSTTPAISAWTFGARRLTSALLAEVETAMKRPALSVYADPQVKPGAVAVHPADIDLVLSRIGPSEATQRKAARDAEISDLAKSGMSNRQISEKLDVPLRTVERKVSRLAVKPPPPAPVQTGPLKQAQQARAAEIAALLDENWTHSRIAAALGVRRSTVERVATSRNQAEDAA